MRNPRKRHFISNDSGHHKGAFLPGRGIGKGGIPVKPFSDRILPENIENRDNVGQGFHPGGVQLLQLLDVGQDVIELPGEQFDFFGHQR